MALQLAAAAAPAHRRALAGGARRVAKRLRCAVPGGRCRSSIDVTRTAGALLVVRGGVVLSSSCARRIFADGGVRIVARGIALIGLLLSAVALAQDATAHGLMYWRWKPLDEGPPPFGPFVNRNHFATWVMMAMPSASAISPRTAAAHRRTSAPRACRWRRRIATFFDGRAIVAHRRRSA